MFTGIVTALGTVRAINPLGDGRDMRLDRSPPPGPTPRRSRSAPRSPVPAAASPRSRSVPTGSPPTPRPRPCARPRSAAGGSAAGSTSNARCAWATNWAATWSPAMSTASAKCVSARRRHGSIRFVFRVPRRPGALHRGQGQRRGGRRIVDGQRGYGRHFRREHHPAHRRGHQLRRACSPGDAVNIEIDMLARYVARLAEFK